MSADQTSPVPTAPAPTPAEKGQLLLLKAAEAKAAEQAAVQIALAAPIRRSESIAQLAAALAVAQGSILPAVRDSANPYFKSKYASLAAIQNAARDALSRNGLAVLQLATTRGRTAIVTTLLTHSSGEWIEERLAFTSVDDKAQALGGVITYGRRYGYAAIVGVAVEDDDAEAASHPGPEGVKWDKAKGPLQRPSGVTDDLPDRPETGAAEGSDGPRPSGTVPAESPAPAPPASPRPSVAGPAAPVARPIARPKVTAPSPEQVVAAAGSAGAGVLPTPSTTPPPPGMKPPARMPVPAASAASSTTQE